MVEYGILGLSIAGSFAIGSFVFAQNPRNATNQIYGLLALFFIVLALANSLSLNDSYDQLFFIRLVMASSTIVVYLFYLLMQQLGREHRSFDLPQALLGALTVMVFTIDFSPLVFSGIASSAPTPGAGIFVYLIHFVALLSFSAYELHSGINHSSSQRRQQFKVLMFGLMPTLLLAPITSFIMPVFFQETGLVVLTPLYSLFLVAAFGYAIIKHGLFDIKFAAVRSAVYVFSLATLAAVYYLVAYIASVIIFKGQVNEAFSASPLNILLALVLAFIFQPIRRFFDRITDSIFYRDRYSTDDFMVRIGDVTTTTTDLRSLLKRISVEIASTLKVEQAFMYVRYGKTRHMSSGTRHYTRPSAADFDLVSDYIKEDCDRVVVTRLMPEDHEVRRMLNSYGVAVLVPLVAKGDILGYLALGEQKGGGYAERDLKVLSTISDGLVVAIQNALSVQEVKDINAHLEQRIESATKELKESNTRLRKLDETKDEFLSMASHQLRTPLTSVKGYISMVLEGDAGNITKQQQKLLTEAFNSSERMVRLIGDFLNVSRLQTGKFMLDLQPVDLGKVIGDEVESMRMMAKAHGQTLYYDGPDSVPETMIDEDKTRQVIMNFIDNAIYYSHQDTDILIKLYTQRSKVFLEVHDQGIGVPRNQQAQLFTKFFRADNARQQRPDGTGVGLFLAKKVIEAQDGEIIFHSRPEMGSVFGFWLPIKK